jgi:hypothetical protein
MIKFTSFYRSKFSHTSKKISDPNIIFLIRQKYPYKFKGKKKKKPKKIKLKKKKKKLGGDLTTPTIFFVFFFCHLGVAKALPNG